MNDNAINCYKQAMEFAYNQVPGNDHPAWHTLVVGKMAELLVKECANICEIEGEKKSSVNLLEEAIQSRKLSCMLKNYFGVIK